MELIIKNFEKKIFKPFETAILNHYDIDIKKVEVQESDNRLTITLEYLEPKTLFEIGLNTGFGACEKQPLYMGKSLPEPYEKYIIN